MRSARNVVLDPSATSIISRAWCSRCLFFCFFDISLAFSGYGLEAGCELDRADCSCFDNSNVRIRGALRSSSASNFAEMQHKRARNPRLSFRLCCSGERSLEAGGTGRWLSLFLRCCFLEGEESWKILGLSAREGSSGATFGE